MKEKDHSIRNGVIATLFASVIIAAVKPIRDIVLVVLKWVLGVIFAFAKHLVSAVSVPWWLVYVVIGLLLILLWRGARRVIEDLETDETKQSHLKYTTDRFHGLVWRWSMMSNSRPYNISTFCPHCDMQLRPISLGYGDSTQFRCDKCGFKSKDISITSEMIDDWVTREIQRKLRTEEWKQGLQSQ